MAKAKQKSLVIDPSKLSPDQLTTVTQLMKLANKPKPKRKKKQPLPATWEEFAGIFGGGLLFFILAVYYLKTHGYDF